MSPNDQTREHEESNKERNCRASVWSREKNRKRGNGRRTVCREIALVFDECMRNSLLKLAQRRRLSLLEKLWKLIRADYYLRLLQIYFIRLKRNPPRRSFIIFRMEYFSIRNIISIEKLTIVEIKLWFDRVFLVKILFLRIGRDFRKMFDNKSLKILETRFFTVNVKR